MSQIFSVLSWLPVTWRKMEDQSGREGAVMEAARVALCFPPYHFLIVFKELSSHDLVGVTGEMVLVCVCVSGGGGIHHQQ